MKKEIKEEETINQIYFLTGNDIQINEKTSNLLTKLISAEAKDLNYNLFYGNENQTADIISYAETPPIGSEYRIIHIKDFNSIQNKKIFEDTFKSLLSTTIFIITQPGNIKLPASLEKILSKQGLTKRIDCRELSGNENKQIITSFFKNNQTEITSEAIEYITYICTSSDLNLNHELEKILLFCEKKSINLSDIEVFFIKELKYTIFNLIETILSKDLQKTMLFFKDYVDKGESLISFIRLLYNEIKILILFKESINNNLSEQDAFKATKKPYFVLKKIKQQAKAFKLKELYIILNQLYKIEVSIKSEDVIHQQIKLLNLFQYICS